MEKKSSLETGTAMNPLLIINHINPRSHPAVIVYIVIRTGGDHAHPVCRPKRLPLEHLQQRRAAEAGGLQRAASSSNPTLCRLRHHPPAGWPFYPPATCLGSFLVTACKGVKVRGRFLGFSVYPSSFSSLGGRNQADWSKPLPLLPQLVSSGAYRGCGSS